MDLLNLVSIGDLDAMPTIETFRHYMIIFEELSNWLEQQRLEERHLQGSAVKLLTWIETGIQELERKELESVLSQKQREIDVKLEQLPKQKGNLKLQKSLECERTMLSPSKPLNPPTLCNARLQEFIQHTYDTLKASLDRTVMKLQEPFDLFGERLDDLDSIQTFIKEKHTVVRKLQEDVADLICDLRSLYQWIREEDNEVSQKALECLLQTLLSTFWLSVYLSEESYQGGFRNLLLDGWWLEFWEIILLAAGDVERNPGPIDKAVLAQVSNTPLEEDDFSEVFKVVLPASGNWRMLCCFLGLPPSLLDSIRNDHPGDTKGSLFEGLQQWIQGSYNIQKYGPPTWRKLVEAMDSLAGGSNPALALEIAKQHQAVGASPQPSISTDPAPETDPERGQEVSVAFANMCRSVTRLLGRSLDVNELKDFLDYFCHPEALHQRCVDPEVYRGAKSTKGILKSLCPDYINPMKLFVLEGIVETFGSQRCKRIIRHYKENYC